MELNSNENILLLFPTSVYMIENLLTKEENQKISNRVTELKDRVENGGKNWSCNTINSLGTFDLREDPTFSSINELVTEKVNNFAKFFNSNYWYNMTESWYNFSLKGSFQEGHVHARNVFSCVYYASAPKGSGDLLLYSDKNEMNPLYNVKESNAYNTGTHKIFPKEGLLVIFSSCLRHMVEVGYNEKPRISLSYNFN